MVKLLPAIVTATWLLGIGCGGADEVVPIDAAVAIDGAVDAPIDAVPLDADLRCGACTASEICVQFFDGTCGDGTVRCEPRAPQCTGNACTADCQFWHCGAADAGIYTCFAAPCSDEAPGALHCYGP